MLLKIMVLQTCSFCKYLLLMNMNILMPVKFIHLHYIYLPHVFHLNYFTVKTKIR